MGSTLEVIKIILKLPIVAIISGGILKRRKKKSEETKFINIPLHGSLKEVIRIVHCLHFVVPKGFDTFTSY